MNLTLAVVIGIGFIVIAVLLVTNSQSQLRTQTFVADREQLTEGGQAALDATHALIPSEEETQAIIDQQSAVGNLPTLCSCHCQLQGQNLCNVIHGPGSFFPDGCPFDRQGGILAFGSCSNANGRTCLGYVSGDVVPRFGVLANCS